MAVPKKKQSHSRTAKRRAQHSTAAVPTVSECPRCHSPRRPHRVCPVCGTYRGREVVSAPADGHDHDHE